MKEMDSEFKPVTSNVTIVPPQTRQKYAHGVHWFVSRLRSLHSTKLKIKFSPKTTVHKPAKRFTKLFGVTVMTHWIIFLPFTFPHFEPCCASEKKTMLTEVWHGSKAYRSLEIPNWMFPGPLEASDVHVNYMITSYLYGDNLSCGIDLFPKGTSMFLYYNSCVWSGVVPNDQWGW